MIVIGELLNSTRKPVRKAVADGDSRYIQDIARRQEEAGADYLDVNAGAFAEQEAEKLEWMIKTIREVSDLPLCIDSPKPEILELGCRLAGDKDLIVNSISLEEERYNQVLPVIKEHEAGVIALAMDDEGLTVDSNKMFDVACRLVRRLLNDGVAPENIYLDPLVRPVGTDCRYGFIVLNLLKRLNDEFPSTHLICGLSNISYGLPERKLINRTFLVMAMACGLCAAILDPLDESLMTQRRVARMLLGRDDYCMDYISAARAGELET